MQDDEVNYRILKAVDANPFMSQRELAASLGVSVGKVNYCLKALVNTGLISVENLDANLVKRVHTYVLTPGGLKEKARVTVRFLQRRMEEYERIKREIVLLKSEVEQSESPSE
ncbi:MAG: MarR family EPS-associated transcriptional regulator [Gammaproteobacteria bacterium]|nr:MarR family EPS-associated transcriptional regulator [Gammaproteobacteria bacterium]